MIVLRLNGKTFRTPQQTFDRLVDASLEWSWERDVWVCRDGQRVIAKVEKPSVENPRLWITDVEFDQDLVEGVCSWAPFTIFSDRWDARRWATRLFVAAGASEKNKVSTTIDEGEL